MTASLVGSVGCLVFGISATAASAPPLQLSSTTSTLQEVQSALGQRKFSGTGYVFQKTTLDFGVTASGVLAPILVGGNRAVRYEWSRNFSSHSEGPTQQSFAVLGPPGGQKFQSALKQLGARISPLLRSLADRRKLAQFIQKFRTLCEGLQVPEGPWRVAWFSAAETFQAEGGVPGTLKIGGEFELTLFWKPDESEPGADIAQSQIRPFGKVVLALAADILKVENQQPLSQYELSEVRLGVGEGKNFDLFFGKVSRGFRGMIALRRAPHSPQTAALLSDQEGYLVGLEGLEEGETLLVNRQSFQKGLRRAVGLSRNFLKLAERVPSQQGWELDAIETSFRVSRSGAWNLPWVRQRALAELRFEKKDRIRQSSSEAPLSHRLRFQPLASFGLPATLRIFVSPLLELTWAEGLSDLSSLSSN